MSKKNELVETKNSEVVAVDYNANEWGDVTLEQKDLVLPKILLQQSISEAVKQKKMQDGEFLNTLTDENMGSTVELLPFYKRESIVVEKYNGKKFIFDSIHPYDGKMRPFEEEINGVRFKNSHLYEFFALTKELGLPHIIAFKGTSNKVGKQLSTLMYASNIAEKLTPAGKWINYTSKVETNKDGDMYHVSAFSPLKRSTQEEVKECLKWISVLKESKFEAAEEAPMTLVESNRF
jgi:hypothetical protein